MISLRRLAVSALAGALLLVFAVQASAAPSERALEVGFAGVERGMTAVDDLWDGSTVTVGPGLERAIAAIEAWFERDHPGAGSGPVTARQVHEALLAGENPSTFARSSVPGLARVYANFAPDVAAKVDAARQRGKSGDNGNQGKADERGNGGSGRGQRTRP